ncbi:MAG: cytochrome c oxidase subunit II [Burkholderiaceae bacterium]|nr:cytochrome c oxidase subunit II [Burkholderiaceae bacterium]
MRLERAAGILASGCLGAWSSVAFAIEDLPGGPKRWGLNLQDPVTEIAADLHWIHWYVMWVCVAIFVLVFGVMIWSIIHHRKSKGHRAADFHESTAIEIAWTIVPFLIVVALSIPATRMVVEQKDTANADLTVKATGYQWRWGYDYLNGEGEGISFLSTLKTPRDQIDDRLFPGAKERREANNAYLLEVDNPLVVPVNKKVRVVITANDVIHAWMVPSFGVKQDAIPGFVRDSWFRAQKVGVYRGQCAELCGKDHAFMPIVVDVRSQEDYAKWVQEKKAAISAKAEDPDKVWNVADLQARGQEVFAANCVACHQADGKGVPGTFPALAGSKVVLGDPHGQIDVVLHGRPGTAMASFKQLSDTDLAAVITYTRHAWGNQAKDGLVQPAEIASARK